MIFQICHSHLVRGCPGPCSTTLEGLVVATTRVWFSIFHGKWLWIYKSKSSNSLVSFHNYAKLPGG